MEHHNSFWPIFITIATVVFLVGFVLKGERPDGSSWDYRPIVIPLGLLGMIFCVVGWVREDVHELRGKPYQEGHSDYLFGTILLIFSEVVLFAILFTFYFWSRWKQGADFVPEQILGMDMLPIWINTALLISSGVTVEVAKHMLKKGSVRGFRIWLGITVLLGALFVLGQAREYVTLSHEGLNPTTSVYATAFYSLTGVHGLHVLAGVAVLATILGLSFTGFATKERLSGMEGAFIYWHFVDAIWVLVVTVVYLRVI